MQEKPERIVVASPHTTPVPDAARIERSPNMGAEDSLSVRLALEGSDALLEYRLGQQVILSDFGLSALQSHDLEAMLANAAALCAEGMRVSLSKVLEYRRNSDDLLIRAGVGWEDGVVGIASIGADLASPAGYALKTGKPVISNHLDNEERFRTPQVLAEHGVMRALNVLIVTAKGPWGVLEVDSRDEGRFEAADIAFLQGFANLIGVAIERQDAEDALRQAIEHQKLLVLETSHRVKNSLALVSSLLRLQARSAASPAAVDALEEASLRIAAVSEAHNQLWQADAGGKVDLAEFTRELCKRLQAQAPDIELRCVCESVQIAGNLAVAAGLFFTELITNAMKHAYRDQRGVVMVRVAREVGEVVLEVADEGYGLPQNFDAAEASRHSLGMKMVRSLAAQLQGRLIFESGNGTRVQLHIADTP